MSDSATTLKGKFKVGLGKWLGVAAIVVLGGLQIRGAVDSWTRVGGSPTAALLGTNTGAVNKVNGVTVEFSDVIPLRGSGGLAKYNLASVRLKDYGITGSGLLTTAMVHWTSAPAGGTSDITIGKCNSNSATLNASGTLLPNGNNISNSSGAVFGLNGTGSVRVNGADCIQVKSLTNATNSAVGYLIIQGGEDLSE